MTIKLTLRQILELAGYSGTQIDVIYNTIMEAAEKRVHQDIKDPDVKYEVLTGITIYIKSYVDKPVENF